MLLRLMDATVSVMLPFFRVTPPLRFTNPLLLPPPAPKPHGDKVKMFVYVSSTDLYTSFLTRKTFEGKIFWEKIFCTMFYTSRGLWRKKQNTV